jgi:uncharacterized membrane protein YbhN (UPF0104 family)/tRNA A-37 threonylcarbamoyl transferase component Bud32
MFVADEPGRRNRRPVDGFILATGALVVGLGAVIAETASTEDSNVAHALVTVLGWAPALWRAALVGAAGLALMIIADGLLRRRWALVRDLAVGVALVAAITPFLGRLVDADWFPVEPHLWSRWGFPELRLAVVVVILVVAAPELTRPVRRVATWVMPLAAVGTVALGASAPSHAMAGVAFGLAAGAAVRLAFGSAAGVPSVERVRTALATLGVQVETLTISPRQPVGSTVFVGQGANRMPLNVRVLGRDAQDTQRLARRWRLLAYRDPPRSAPVGRLEQVEHEALATLMSATAGVRVPSVVAVGLGPEDDALLVTCQPDIEPLEVSHPDQLSDAILEDLCRQVARLHEAGISHGRLNLSNVLIADGRPMLTNFSAATLGAPQPQVDMDVAELLVSSAVLVGAERTLNRAIEAGWSDAIARVLPYLQPAALTPHLRDLARAHEVELKELRAAAAAATGSTQPEIAPLLRIRPRDILLMAALVFAAYLLISQLAEIGFDTIAHELREADAAWVIVALLLAQTTFIPSGISVRGGVATPLPLLPCVVLQSALKFINLTVPSSAGRIATNLRCLQRMGAPRAEAIAGGAIDDASNTIVQATLLLITLPLVGVDLDTSQFQGAGPDRRLLAAIGIAVALSLAVVLMVPKVRATVVPGIRDAARGAWSVARDRHKRQQVFGGAIAGELLYALALGATCLAYGIHLNIAQLVFINVGASMLSGLIPVPGGIGAAEAALAAGLIAVGVDKSTAFAIAVTQRLCTFYLPPIWGYISLRWLTRKGYV